MHCVYILASKRYGTLYTGYSSDIVKRIAEHKSGLAEGFTKKYNVKTLVYYEFHDEHEPALIRERQIKEWKRPWKIDLIEKSNPNWFDLTENVLKL